MYLAKLAMLSKSLKRVAGSNELWNKLLDLSFGPDAACQLTMPLPRLGPFAAMSIYSSIVREISWVPSLYARSIFVERRGGCALLFDTSASSRLPYRALTLSEASRVAVWGSEFTLVHEARARRRQSQLISANSP